MGWRDGAYATVWPWTDKEGREHVVNSVSDKLSTAKISIRSRVKGTDEYETQFNNFVRFVGTSAAQKARMLKARDRIKLLRVEYIESMKDGKKYDNWMVYDFEIQDQNTSGSGSSYQRRSSPPPTVDDGEFDPEDRLPF